LTGAELNHTLTIAPKLAGRIPKSAARHRTSRFGPRSVVRLRS
jgi:hypothetical protein